MARIRLGMVGGGQDAFIGAVHRIAARLDDEFELVAGALSSTPERARDSGAALGLDSARCYATFGAMAEAEAARSDGIEAVVIVTPNHIHASAAIAFLGHGIHVICDKPLTATLDQAQELHAAVQSSSALFFLTHNYTGYPMIRQAREMVAAGELGRVRTVQVEYVQDWLTEAVEATGANKQAEWRTDPARSGTGGAIADIGTHAYHLACFVSGLTVDSLSADLQTFVPGRRVDDNAHVLLRFSDGARGMLWCSQVAPGNENGLRLRLFGERAGIEWEQEDPNHLWFSPYRQSRRLLTRRGAGASDALNRLSRTPAGHPEGYLEGFANLYTEAARAIRAAQRGEHPAKPHLLPGIEAGLAGMRFIDACIRSSETNAAWVNP